MGNNYVGRITTITAVVLMAIGSLLGMLQLNPVLFPHVGKPTATYDCDDETLDMYLHFEGLGLKCTPVVGNLETTGENYSHCNHVWLMVTMGNRQIAYDWGTPRFDKQHYEGYKISYDYLLYVVEQDKKNPNLLPIAGN
jgi:hypothetical protein